MIKTPNPGYNCSMWKKGSHARHFKPTPEWPVEALIHLNEENGFRYDLYFYKITSSL